MSEHYTMEQEEIFSKVMRAGRRTYFFDVRSTKAGDFYLTITESKKFTNDDGSYHYKKHKIYLYKEDFNEFKETLAEMIDYVIDEKGEEVISERHQKNYKPAQSEDGKETDKAPVAAQPTAENTKTDTSSFTDIEFDDI
ncbi:PUR family DNA/RNA-binding protein [Aequorivita sp. F47161]|uniref:PUR family DNA/RNA-binding protein n=1 Tax=Aequorivita vitellina TaxID=2874475 RepID=A0A9X1UA99_9FLAO|nr:PUR family DNA/RNA-binding protein [Aequorivita vitellina]MCG2419406.1 PUR family DNA/RNA-binding protein [Aequorivita vitellina]MCZ4318585.1 PUR family DNA/RNA-binding protein [Aequorivita viscosa]